MGNRARGQGPEVAEGRAASRVARRGIDGRAVGLVRDVSTRAKVARGVAHSSGRRERNYRFSATR
jgi:hypothetical protein